MNDLAQSLAPQVMALASALQARGECLAVAESCTGGWLAQVLTAQAGSSAWFDRGFVTYSNAAKQEMLAVPATTLAEHGAVSPATALAMASGVLAHSAAQWAVAITGIAGPGGGSAEKPVGTVCFAWAGVMTCEAETCCFAGDRHEVRAQAVEHALRGLLLRIAATPLLA